MIKLDGCNVTTAKPVEEIIENIKENIRDYTKVVLEVQENNFWRENTEIALVGGGPSLKYTIKDLYRYKYVVACGSVHDYLISNNIYPDYCIICDPDEIVLNYLTKKSHVTEYLLASQCSPKVFDYLNKTNKVSIWHAGGENLDSNIFGKDKVVVGGGCTVGTRALCIVIGMGFNNIHLYGFDTCLDKDFKHHAYEFTDKNKETLGNIHEISLGDPDGNKFYVASYMLGQLFDFQRMLFYYAHKIQITVHGEGLLKHLMELAVKGVTKDGN